MVEHFLPLFSMMMLLLLMSFFSSALAQQQIHPDVLVVLNVTGGVTPGANWADSYSVGNECFCDTTFDHNIAPYYVETPLGWKTVKQVCDLLGPGPGKTNRPVYNDVQCGNGPPNDAGDEHVCPGRTDIGEAACGHIGPRWKFDNIFNDDGNMTPPPLDAHPDIVAVLNVTGGIVPNVTMASSYSVGGDCYCISSIDNGIGDFYVETLLGWKTVRDVCDLVGPGPGAEGRPRYNDIQCGNGPPSAAGDEHICPGRVDVNDACGHIGPKWSFVQAGMPSMAPSMTSSFAPSMGSSIDDSISRAPSMSLSFAPSMGSSSIDDSTIPTATPLPGYSPPTVTSFPSVPPSSNCESYSKWFTVVAILLCIVETMVL
jgi:hypothetical protein